MSLPESRERTYAVGSQLFSADMNKIQDTIISAHYHGERILHVHAFAGHPSSGAFDANGYWLASAGSQEIYVPIPLHQGNRIKAVNFKYWTAGVGAKTLEVVRITTAASTYSALTPGDWSDSVNPGAGPARVEWEVSDPPNYYPIGEDEFLFAHMVSGVNGDRLYGIAVIYDRPTP